MPLSTEAQLELITLTATNAAEKAATRKSHEVLRRYRNNAVIGFLVLGFGVGFTIYDSGHQGERARSAVVQSGRAVSVSGCNRDFDTIGILRGVLLNAQSFQTAALKRGDITQAQFDRAQEYYDSQLAKLKQPDCREAEKLLTDDPNAPIPTVKPKYLVPDAKPPAMFPGTEPKG